MHIEKVKQFFSDYKPALLGVFILLAELALDFIGVHIENGFTLAFAIFICLILFQAVKPQKELNKLLRSHPRIHVKNAYSKKNFPTTDFIITDPFNNTITSRYPGGTVPPTDYKPAFRAKYGDTDNSDVKTTKQTYVLVEFQNNPERRAEVHDAIGVIARIKYYGDDGKNILGKEIKGLWTGIEPSRIIAPKEDYEFTQMTIPASGDERILCIGVKHKDDEDCYAYTLKSYQDGEFLKSEDLKLGIGVIRAEITLSGSNLDDMAFSFRMVNPGKGRDITITEIDQESNVVA